MREDTWLITAYNPTIKMRARDKKDIPELFLSCKYVHFLLQLHGEILCNYNHNYYVYAGRHNYCRKTCVQVTRE
jgi:hypothetical protein